ncbi:hypothetical protein EON67_03325 [archaeon]|nr:MAG: hypothetical protein EON67_03325 [archaeon]
MAAHPVRTLADVFADFERLYPPGPSAELNVPAWRTYYEQHNRFHTYCAACTAEAHAKEASVLRATQGARGLDDAPPAYDAPAKQSAATTAAARHWLRVARLRLELSAQMRLPTSSSIIDALVAARTARPRSGESAAAMGTPARGALPSAPHVPQPRTPAEALSGGGVARAPPAGGVSPTVRAIARRWLAQARARRELVVEDFEA